MEDFVLVVDDEMAVRELLSSQLSFLGLSAQTTEAQGAALRIAASDAPSALVLLDIEMPGSSGVDLLRQIKKIDEDIQVVMISGLHDFETVRKCLRSGAYDYLAKPFELEDLHATVERAFEHRLLIRQNRDCQKNLERMVEEQTEEIRQTRDIALLTLARLAESRDTETGQHLERMSAYSRILAEGLRDSPYRDQVDDEFVENLERMVEEQTEEIRQTRDIALLTLARLAESRDTETGQHLDRMSAYSRILAEGLRDSPYRDQVDDEFVEWLFKSSPLHDIGKVGIPDTILRKPGPLTDGEWEIMRTHTTAGGDTLRSVLEEYSGPTFLTMAMEIAYSHHERWDGGGYPHGLAMTDIPLPARIVTLAEAYDAITSERPYKRAEDHEEAVRQILIDRSLHFDPVIVDAFVRCQHEFESVQLRLKDQLPATADQRTATG